MMRVVERKEKRKKQTERSSKRGTPENEQRKKVHFERVEKQSMCEIDDKTKIVQQIC